jgi:WD40 repeat protein
VLALRGDFFYTDLKSTDLWPETFSERLEIDPLRGEALRDAIEKPAAREGVYLEPVLVERLIADAAEERGALPLVQETMFQLWDKMEQRFISLDAYRRLGGGERSGLAGALVTFANTTLDALVRRSPQHETIAHRIFLRLVQFGEGRADTRRQQPKAALCSWDNTAAVFDETLQYLAQSRLLTLSGEEDQDRQVDIAHEALFTEWPVLKKLVSEYRKDEQMRRRLEDWADYWVKRGRDSKALLNALELSQAEEWLSRPAAGELGYSEALLGLVQASRAAIEEAEQKKEAARQRELEQERALAAEQAKSARRLRRLAVVLAAMFLVAIGTALYARGQQEQAIKNEQLAATRAAEEIVSRATSEAERQRADDLAKDIHLRQLLVQSGSLLADRYGQALLLSIAAYRQADTDETRDNLLRVLRAQPQLIRHIPVSDTPTVIAFSPDGGTLVALTQDGIRFWDAETGVSVPSVSMVIDGSHVDTRDGKTSFSSQGSTIQLWDLSSKPEPHFLSGLQTDEVSPDGRLKASWGKGGVVLQDVATGKLIGTLGDPFLEYGYNLTFSPDGEQLVAASDGPGELIIYEVVFIWELGRWLEDYREYPEQYPKGFWADEADRQYIPVDDSLYRADVTNFIFSPDGRNLAANVSKHVDVSYLLDGGPTELWQGEAALTSLTSCRDGALAAGRKDGKIVFYGSTSQLVFHHPGPVNGLVLSADCNHMASVGGGVLTLWDLSATGSALALQPISIPIATLAAVENALFSGWDYSGAVSGSECTRKASQLFEDSPCVQSSIPGGYAGFTGITTSLEESPDGKTVAAGICSEYEFYLEDAEYHPESCDASEVWVWLGGPTEGMKLGETQGVAVTELIFSPDGKALAAVYQDGSIMIWDVDIESLIAEACYKVGRNLTDIEWTALTGYDQPDRPACPSTERPDPNRWAATLKQLEPLLAAPRPTITPWPTRTSMPTWTPRPTVTPRLTRKPTPTMTPRTRPGDGG